MKLDGRLVVTVQKGFDHGLHLQGEPKGMITTAEGLVNVCQYLDAMRGRI